MLPILALMTSLAAPALPLLSPMFSDHMVLQRDKPNTFWGWTSPGATVTVSVGGHAASCTADASGKWMAKINPPASGGPYTVTVDGPSRVELHDVLVGDVWLCTGQSNMEMGLSQAKDGAAEVANAHEPQIRLFMAGRQVGYAPAAVNKGEWRVCSPENVARDGWGGFSAVGYFFGRELQHTLKVPIGLVSVNWGGTSAEAWTREPALRPLHDFDADLDKIDSLRKSGDPAIGTYIDLWLAKHDLGSKPGASWSTEETDVAGWETTQLPSAFPTDFDGVRWFRREIDLPDPLPAGHATLSLGKIDHLDGTWVNGKLVGFSSGRDHERHYWLWPGSIKPGRNVITVRVFDRGGAGGFLSPADDLFIDLGDGNRRPLAGEWRTRMGADLKVAGETPKDFEPNPTVPTVLNNGMIAPIAPLAIRGAIWYQGETNSGRAVQYRRLLPAMIADWRNQFGQGDFPFYIVSLAAFMAPPTKPGDDGWAELRDAQAFTAATVKNSGLAITTDVGDEHDVHPKDKKTVGLRLAANALAKTYRLAVPYSGPVFRSMKAFGARIDLTFDHSEGGLQAHGDLKGFAIAGTDRKWHWAHAEIVGDRVVVTSPEVPNPVAVRYAWAANPPSTLYNSAGFPAVPFRTDDWPMVTAGNR